MYESFFNLNSKPFDLLPNPDYLYLSDTHGKALTYLRYGIQERVGFILLTGEIGAGKTTLIRELIKTHLSKVVLAKVFNTRVDSHQLLNMINDDFGLKTSGRSRVELFQDLNAFLIDQFAQGNQAVLIIDEAQNLSSELLEEVRMLSNLETDGGKLLQIIMVGQPELRQTLSSSELVQLRQRVQVACHLSSLQCEELEDYILTRLEKAGNREALEFKGDAIEEIFDNCKGIPRLANILCDYILMDACVNNMREIDGDGVREIVADLDFKQQYWSIDAPHEYQASRKRSIVKSRSAQRVLRTIKGIEARVEMIEKEVARGNTDSLMNLLNRLDTLENKVMRLEGQQMQIPQPQFVRQVAQRPDGNSTEHVDKYKRKEKKRSWLHKVIMGDG